MAIRQPSLDELRAAFAAPISPFDPSKITQAYATGSTLADTIASKKLERQKAEQELMAEIEKVKQGQMKTQGIQDVTRLINPITPATPASTAIPATLGQVANVNPDTGDVQQTGTEIVHQDEANRIPQLKAAAFKVAPEQTAASLVGTPKNPMLAINRTTGATRVVTPDASGNLNLQPDEQIKDLAVAETRAAPFKERNKIMAQQLAQRGDFKSADLATKLGEKLSLGSLHGSDQVAAKNLDQITRTQQLIAQIRQDQANAVTPQQMEELALGTARAISGQSVIASERVNGLLPDTAKGRYANYAQFLKSKPNPVELGQFVDNLDATLSREHEINKRIVTRAIRKNTSGLAQSLKKMAPDAYYQTLHDARTELGDDVVDALIAEKQAGAPEHLQGSNEPAPTGGIHDLAHALNLPRKKGAK